MSKTEGRNNGLTFGSYYLSPCPSFKEKGNWCGGKPRRLKKTGSEAKEAQLMTMRDEPAR